MKGSDSMKVMYSIIALCYIFFVLMFSTAYQKINKDYIPLKFSIVDLSKNDYHDFLTGKYYIQTGGKVNIVITSKTKASLMIYPEDIIIKGCSGKVSVGKTGNLSTNITIENISPQKDIEASITLAKGTIVDYSGTVLSKDLIYSNFNIINSNSEIIAIRQDSFKKMIMPITFIIFLILIGVLIAILFLRKYRRDIDVYKGVKHIAIVVISTFIGLGLPVLALPGFGVSHHNDVGILILINFTLIPCMGTSVFLLFSTLFRNISTCGIFGGVLLLLVQLAIVIGIFATFGLLLIVIMVGTRQLFNSRDD